MAISISGAAQSAGYHSIQRAFGAGRDAGRGGESTAPAAPPSAAPDAPRGDRVTLSGPAGGHGPVGGAKPANGYEALQQTSKVVKNDSATAGAKPANGYEALQKTSKVVKNDSTPGAADAGGRPSARELLEQTRVKVSSDPGGQIGSRLSVFA